MSRAKKKHPLEVDFPMSVSVQLTRAQLRALKPLFKAVNDTFKLVGSPSALYAQPWESGTLNVGFLAPAEAKRVVEFMRKVIDKRPARRWP